jgi:large subunit ribosomal protein L18
MAQVIDDAAGHTLAAVSTLTPKVRENLKIKMGANKDAAELVGKTLAEVCLSKNIGKVFFDRGGFKYHGRVQVSGMPPLFEMYVTDRVGY